MMPRRKLTLYPLLCFIGVCILGAILIRRIPRLAGAAPAPAGSSITAPQLIGQDFRISNMGPDADTRFFALDPAIAYNSSANEHLIVWAADDESGDLANDEFEIYAQRVNAATGAPTGSRLRISNVGSDGDSTLDAYDPAVAYNSIDDEYLVVWQADAGVDDEIEIYGQRLDAGGSPVGTDDFRISTMGTDGDPAFDAFNPSLAYNPTQNEYLVVWHGDNALDNVIEIYGQRLNAATGAEIGTDDFFISNMGTSDTDKRFRAQDVAVAYNSTDDEYLVVWEGDDDTLPLVNDELEIFGQRLADDGSPVGDNDFRISDMGPNGNTAYAADNPAVAYNRDTNTYLVVWSGDDDRDFGSGPLSNDELEVFGQHLAADGTETGDNDFRISDMGPDGNPTFKTFGAEALYIPALDEYLVVWRGDDDRDFGDGPLVNDEMEIFGQWLDGSTGAALGEDDFRISDAGNNDGDPAFDADRVAIAAHISDAVGIVLAVWQGDDETGTLAPDEIEILGQQFANPRLVEPSLIYLPLVKRND
ncbi:MAG: hypothetical protein GY832_45830 [Chloroflexi bacterium]|nr:hypothetical protein [Chloroflexota bacterium]